MVRRFSKAIWLHLPGIRSMSLLRLFQSTAKVVLFVAVVVPTLFSNPKNNKNVVSTCAALIDEGIEDLFQVSDINGCRDNPDFHFKNSIKKTCEWISNNPKHKKDKTCSKVTVERNCPESCGLCNEDENLVSTKCPQKLGARAFKKVFCDSYATDLGCGYEYVFTGDCRTGEIACTPTSLYTCEIAEIKKNYKRRRWKLSHPDANTESCTMNTANDIRRPYYGKQCNPRKCPPIEPIPGSSCEWFKGGKKKGGCGYDPRWYGCTHDSLTCEASRTYKCSPLTKTWTVYDRPMDICTGKKNAIPGRGGTCDPGNIKNPGSPQKVENILWFLMGISVMRLVSKSIATTTFT